mgnify:FL=1
MDSLFFGLLAIFSLLAFVSLGKIKASTKQLNRSDRIKWRRYRDEDLNEETKNSKDANGEPTQSNDQEIQ